MGFVGPDIFNVALLFPVGAAALCTAEETCVMALARTALPGCLDASLPEVYSAVSVWLVLRNGRKKERKRRSPSSSSLSSARGRLVGDILFKRKELFPGRCGLGFFLSDLVMSCTYSEHWDEGQLEWSSQILLYR